VLSEHLEVFIMEAPSLEAIQKLFMEPELLAINTVDSIEIKPAMNFEDTVKMFKQFAAPIPA
jgi:hypothetical protein